MTAVQPPKVQNISAMTKPAIEEIAVVEAWPDSITVRINTRDGDLTVEQGRELAKRILDICDLAEKITWANPDSESAELVMKTDGD